MKAVRFLVGLLLLPLCVAATQTVGALVRSLEASSGRPGPAAWSLIGGFGLWLFVYFTLPRPARGYVLAHELTHALWGWLMGAQVSRLRVFRESGSVTLSKSNFVILLAPYFFPLYTVLVIVGYGLLSVFVAVEPYAPVWLGMVGFTWGFHLTFTVTTLLQHQSDIQSCGRVFSYALIYLLNVLGIALWIVLVSPAGIEEMLALLRGYAAAGLAAGWTFWSEWRQ